MSKSIMRMVVTPDAMAIYGPYAEADLEGFVPGVDSAAGRALVSAQVRVIELSMGAQPSEQPVDDQFARQIVGQAVLNGHSSIGDILDILAA